MDSKTWICSYNPVLGNKAKIQVSASSSPIFNLLVREVLRSFRLFSSKILAVAEPDASRLRGLTGKLSTFKTQTDVLLERAGGDAAKLVFFWNAPSPLIWAGPGRHSRAFLARDPADSDFHLISSVRRNSSDV